MGTTGMTHLTAVPAEARGMKQSLTFHETGGDTAQYTMKTSYWNDAPCKSGWMFAACDTDAAFQAKKVNCDANSHDFGSKVTAYMTENQRKANPNCGKGLAMSFCCHEACPKQTCPTDTFTKYKADGTVEQYDACAAPIDCPQYPQCIVNEGLKIGKCPKNPTCSGLPGQVKDTACAFMYPGCGAVDKYSNLEYNGSPTAKNVMNIVATGSAKEIKPNAIDVADSATTLSVREKYLKLCGAKNNLFSYSAAGSADLLAQAAEEVDKYSICSLTDEVTGKPVECPCPSMETTQPLQKCEYECNDGHPDWCACAQIVEITLTSIKVTLWDAGIVNQFNTECTCGLSATQGTPIDLAECTKANCPWLDRIGYGNDGQVYYAQYYRPVQTENMLYLGNQKTSLNDALDTPFHAEGVNTLQSVCAGCHLQVSSLLAVVMTILGVHFINQH